MSAQLIGRRLNVISWKFFIVLIIPPACLWIFFYLFYPETRQRSLEDIAEAFGDKVAVHYFNATEEEEAQYAAEEAMHKHGLTTLHLEDAPKSPDEKQSY